MGRLLEFILFAVVAYFVFKFLNQLFSSSPNTNNNTNAKNNRSQKYNSSSSIKKNINWDAETIDYEEIEKKDDEKK